MLVVLTVLVAVVVAAETVAELELPRVLVVKTDAEVTTMVFS